MKNKVHWCKQKKMWTSHTYKACTKAKVILIDGDWSVETKPENKSNPKGWVFTDDSNVIVNPSDELLLQLKTKSKLIYDKHDVKFNVEHGDMLLFNEFGCFIVEK